MSSATIAVKGNASEEFAADFADVHFRHLFTSPSRSDALAHGNAVIAQLRDVGAQSTLRVRDMKIRSLSVEEAFTSVEPDHVREPTGWSVLVTGEVRADAESVPEVVAALTRVGVTIVNVTWHLEPATEASAQRAVRRQAVDNALEAAIDFAAALGGTLGDLITLADPGLLSAGASGNSRTRSAGAFLASDTSYGSLWDERVDIDTSVITVAASVEASYVVNLD